MDNSKYTWDYLRSIGCNEYGAAGLMGNLGEESGEDINPGILQITFQRSLGMTSEQYTQAVDSGEYTAQQFTYDKAGYGICQFTFWSLKAGLIAYCGSKGKSIGDLQCQLDYMMQVIKNDCKDVWNTLQNATSVREASNAVLFGFERPGDQGQRQQDKRCAWGEKYYKRFAKGESKAPDNKLQDAEHRSNEIRGTYVTTVDLNLRYGADPDKYDVIVSMPQGTKVNCYGYYNMSENIKWPCVVASVGGKSYTGYCSSYYLKKI